MVTNNLAQQTVCIQFHPSPCGELILASLDNALCLCDWKGMPCAERNLRRMERYVNAKFSTASSPVLEQTKQQLDEYFAGRRKEFDIPLHPVGTDFQVQVWSALLHIPYGETRSYKEIAKMIGNEKAVRAVAHAIGANGIDILIPCHRVVGSNHSLTGFAGGLDRKEHLLKLEGHL